MRRYEIRLKSSSSVRVVRADSFSSYGKLHTFFVKEINGAVQVAMFNEDDVVEIVSDWLPERAFEELVQSDNINKRLFSLEDRLKRINEAVEVLQEKQRENPVPKIGRPKKKLNGSKK